MDEERAQWLGGYRLLRRLGTGGAGTVWLAEDGGGQRVALKLLHPALASTEEARRRLAREATTVNQVRSTGVARVLDVEVDDTQPFVVTEFVEGPTLARRLESGALSPREVAALASSLLHTLTTVHAARIIHRDVKPSNVILNPMGPVLIDFGIAMGEDDVHLTSTGLVSGTAGFTAPELLRGGSASPGTDWWSWAATLLQAATARPPFGGGGTPAVLLRVAGGDPDTDGLPEGVARTFRRALSADPAQRPVAADVADVLARPATWTGHTRSGGTAGGAPGGGALPVSGARTEVLGGVPGSLTSTAGVPLPMDEGGAGGVPELEDVPTVRATHTADPADTTDTAREVDPGTEVMSSGDGLVHPGPPAGDSTVPLSLGGRTGVPAPPSSIAGAGERTEAFPHTTDGHPEERTEFLPPVPDEYPAEVGGTALLPVDPRAPQSEVPRGAGTSPAPGGRSPLHVPGDEGAAGAWPDGRQMHEGAAVSPHWSADPGTAVPPWNPTPGAAPAPTAIPTAPTPWEVGGAGAVPAWYPVAPYLWRRPRPVPVLGPLLLLGLAALPLVLGAAGSVAVGAVLLLLGTVGTTHAQRERRRVRHGGERSSDTPVTLAGLPLHLLRAAVSLLTGLLAGALVAGGAWVALQGLLGQEAPDLAWPVRVLSAPGVNNWQGGGEGSLALLVPLWGVVALLLLVAWSLPTSRRLREGTGLVLHTLLPPRWSRAALGALVVVVLTATWYILTGGVV